MNRRDIELLSSYLDGQLKPSESARLEARIAREADLRVVLDDLRSARGLLRQMPMRKAPRNFTLTPKMVGKNPPLPRTYPAFRFVTTLASLLLFFTMGVNFVVPQIASQRPAFGMGGGGSPEILASEAPAAPEAAVTEAPAEDPSIQMLPPPTVQPAGETARDAATPLAKEDVNGGSGLEPRPTAGPVPPVWQVLLAGIAALGALAMVLMRQWAASRWRGK